MKILEKKIDNMADLLGLKHQGDVVTTVTKRSRSIWTTFDGVDKRIENLDTQHLCNIHYFMKYVNPEFYDKSTKHLIACEIDRRLDGKLLPYKPLRRFAGEIQYLKQKNWLVDDFMEHKTLVVIDGKVIGEVDES